MRLLIVTALFVAACASEPAQSTSSQTANPNYDDARSAASDADVGAARRAYRAACERRASTARCECLTGGMAQALAPADLNVATAAMSGAAAPANAAAQARIAAAQSASERACTAYPR